VTASKKTVYPTGAEIRRFGTLRATKAQRKRRAGQTEGKSALQAPVRVIYTSQDQRVPPPKKNQPEPSQGKRPSTIPKGQRNTGKGENRCRSLGGDRLVQGKT